MSSRWRRTSRETIERVIAERTDLHGDLEALFREASKAYPFGERAMHPYKIWLDEVKKQRERLAASFGSITPEYGAVLMVAGDLIEEGRSEEAEKLLEEQAPNRLMRPCVVCGVRPGRPCRELDHDPGEEQGGYRTLLVPHLARVKPSDGPLFGGAP